MILYHIFCDITFRHISTSLFIIVCFPSIMERNVFDLANKLKNDMEHAEWDNYNNLLNHALHNRRCTLHEHTSMYTIHPCSVCFVNIILSISIENCSAVDHVAPSPSFACCTVSCHTVSPCMTPLSIVIRAHRNKHIAPIA